MLNTLIVGNWKMNGSLMTNQEFCSQLKDVQVPKNVDVGICAPHIYLPQLQMLLEKTDVTLGAQDMSVHIKGAYTGEISGAMLQEFDCRYVLVGHSERRQYHGESNRLVGQKALAASQHNLTPIICVGETLEQREAKQTLAVVAEQITAVKQIMGEAALASTVIAYEPVWAIGTGLTATPEQAQEVHAFIRAQLGEHSEKIKILYGGSVNPKNAKALLAQPDINGGLVGGASLKAINFGVILKEVGDVK